MLSKMTHSRQPMYLSDNYNNSMKQIDPDTNADITLQSRINKIKVGTVAEQIIKVRIDELVGNKKQVEADKLSAYLHQPKKYRSIDVDSVVKDLLEHSSTDQVFHSTDITVERLCEGGDHFGANLSLDEATKTVELLTILGYYDGWSNDDDNFPNVIW